MGQFVYPTGKMLKYINGTFTNNHQINITFYNSTSKITIYYHSTGMTQAAFPIQYIAIFRIPRLDNNNNNTRQ